MAFFCAILISLPMLPDPRSGHPRNLTVGPVKIAPRCNMRTFLYI